MSNDPRVYAPTTGGSRVPSRRNDDDEHDDMKPPPLARAASGPQLSPNDDRRAACASVNDKENVTRLPVFKSVQGSTKGGKKSAKSSGRIGRKSKKESKGDSERHDLWGPTLVDMPSSGGKTAFRDTSSPAIERTTFRPRPPVSSTVVGAVAVAGPGGPSDRVTEMSSVVEEGETSLPVARIADDSNQEYLDALGQAEPLSAEDLKDQGTVGWIRSHKVCAAAAVLVVVGAIVGGVCGATLGGSSSQHAPTLEPTQAPTAAPTLAGFEEIVDTLTTITPYSVITDPSTPQNAAVAWLMREDEFEVDFNANAPKLLQRYAVATVYFATVGSSWTRQCQFLTNQDECLWNEVDSNNITYGVKECNEQGLATKLSLCKCSVPSRTFLCRMIVLISRSG